MIKYVGYFKDVEKDYIEKSIPIDSIIIRQDPYYPISSIDEVFEYIDLKLQYDETVVYHFKEKQLHPIITPAIFVSNLLNDKLERVTFLKPEDCIVYIGQGCSENCICTSASKCRFSVSLDNIKKQVLELPQQDYIALYSINVGDYNYNNMTIIDLCKELLKEFPKSNIILCNISPFSSILKDVVEYIQTESRIFPVLFMCVNSGSPKILDIEGHKNINNDLVALLSNTNISLISYLIVGSPEEEREDFELTVKWVEKHKDILLGAIILPYTRNGIGNCNQDITPDELKWRLSYLNDVVIKNSINKNNTNVSNPILKNIAEIALCGEDNTIYKKYM